MTLGGLALAVGVLVDEATVEIENIHTHMLPGVSRARAVVEAAAARRSRGCSRCSVFWPFSCRRSSWWAWAASFSFRFRSRLVLDVASYLLSSTLVPVFSTWLMRDARSRRRKRRLFDVLRSVYERYLGAVLRFRWPLVLGYLAAAVVASLCRASANGHGDLSRTRNAPLLRIRLRAPTGTRVEETERIVLRALDVIHQRSRSGQRRNHQRFRWRGSLQLSGGSYSSVHQRSAGSDHSGSL